ncbi:hypothetical protein [Caudoviricetes sp.]|nr:hypothetical protein [Caudoviricetes sp.]
MSLADTLRPILHAVRAIPGQLGLREHSVALIGARAGGDGQYTGDGGRWELSTPITHSGGYAPRVRWAKDQDVAMGLVVKGTITVGPITSDFTGHAILTKLVGGNLETGAVRLLRITGPKHPTGADYTITSVKAERALHYLITAEPVGTQR